MGIILRFTLRNIQENKLRTLLIIVAVTMSAALFFGSTGLSRTIAKTYTQYLTNYYGSAEIMVYPGDNPPSPFIPDDQLRAFSGEVEYALGVMHARGTYRVSRHEVQPFNILGYEFDHLIKMHDLVLREEAGLEPFRGRKVIISHTTAEEYDLRLNDNIDLEIDGQGVPFKIVAIAQPTALFLNDGRNTYAVVPKDYLNSLNQVRGRADTLYVKLLDGGQKEGFMERVSQAYPRYRVTETVSDADIREYTKQVTQPFLMMVAIVMLISVFIIYTSFKVIARERIPVIGTFRSIGATRKVVNFVFLAESLLYGIIGGLFGCGLGIGVLYIMARLTTPSWLEGITTQVAYTPLHVISTFLLAVTLSLASAFLPIWKVAKIPLKDIVLDNIEKGGSPHKHKFTAGFVFIIFSFVLPPLISGDLLLPFLVLAIILGIAGIILVLPLLILFAQNILQGFYHLVFGNEGILALKNLRDNKNLINNIALLAIGILSILVVKTVGVGVMSEITSFFRDWKFEIQAAPYGADRSTLASMRGVPGVTDAYGAVMVRDVDVVGTGNKIGVVEGINEKFFEFMDIEVPGGPEATVKKLNSGRYILLTNLLKDRLGVKEGDTILLNTPRGDIPYQVLGFLNTIENNGQYALVAERYLKLDLGQRHFDFIYVKTNEDPQEVQERIKQKFSREPFQVETVQSIVDTNRQINQQLFLLIDGFSYLTIFIGIFGVFNNYIISFLERRRAMAVLRSVGMSRKQVFKMLLIEALTGGFIAGVVGIFGGFMGSFAVRYLLQNMGMRGQIQYDPTLLLTAIGTGIVVSVLASLSPILKTSKMSIVEALKYE